MSADVVLSVGCRFTDWSTSSYRRGVTFAIPPARLIQADIDLHTHRYITEDTELGLAFLASAARHAGVDAPIAHGLLAIVGGFLGRDLRRERRQSAGIGRVHRRAGAASSRGIRGAAAGRETPSPPARRFTK